MIAPAPASRHSSTVAHATPRRAQGDTPKLAAFLAALSTGEDDEGDAIVRQADAEGGKAVPDIKVVPDDSTSPLAWLATLMPPATPAPATPAPARPAAGAPPMATPAAQPAPIATAIAAATAPTTDAPPLVNLAESEPAATAPVPEAIAGMTTGNPASSPAPSGLSALARDPQLTSVHGPVSIELPAAPVRHALAPAAPGVALPTIAATPGTAAPAGQIFAAALHAAKQEERAERASPAHDAAQPTLTATAETSAVHAVTGAGDTAGGGALDMRDGRWPHAMMDRIERLRDDANAADTRIRLVPDQLGSIDVAVRREGDTLHVRFHAEQEATRGLLADAQPQLAQIAEQRGMRLGDAEVGGGNAGRGQDRSPAPRHAPVPASPAAAIAPGTDTDTDTDTRIA